MAPQKDIHPSGLLAISQYLTFAAESAWVCTPEGHIVLISDEAKHAFPGICPKETIQACVFPEDIPLVEAALKGTKECPVSPFIFRFHETKGQAYGCHIQATYLELEDAPYIILHGRPATFEEFSAEIIRKIDAEIAAVGETALFDKLVSALGEHLGKNQALVGALSSDQKSISATSLWYDKHILHGASYELEGTPCDLVISGKVPRMFLKAVQESFPEDEDLIKWESQSYVGVPLIGQQGQIIGHIATLSSQPIREEEAKLTVHVLSRYTSRVANIMEQIRTRASFEAIFAHNPNGIVLGTPDSPYMDMVNPAFANMLGYTSEELTGKTIASISDEGFKELHHEVHRQLGKEADRSMGPFTKAYLHKDGSQVLGELTITKVHESPGLPSFHIVMIRNVTQEREAYRRLEAQEATQSAILNSSPDAIAAISRDGRLQAFNPQLAQGYKYLYDLEIQVGDALQDWPDWHFWEPNLQKVWDGEALQFESNLVHEGHNFSIDNAFRPIYHSDGSIIGAAAYFKNVTATKEAERARISDLERFDQVFNNSAIGWIEFDMRDVVKRIQRSQENGISSFKEYLETHPEEIPKFMGTFKGCNKRFLEMVGANSGEEFDRRRTTVYDVELASLLDREINHILSGRAEMEVELSIKSLQGEERHLYFWVNYPPDTDYSSIIYGALDITEQKRIEAELFQHNFLVQQISQTIPDLLYIFDLEKQEVIFANQNFSAFIGHHQVEVKLNPEGLYGQIHLEDLDHLKHSLNLLVTDSGDEAIEVETRIKDAEGNYEWFSTTFKVFRRRGDGSALQFMGIGRNVHQRKINEQTILDKNQELKRYIDSNLQLENFAYIASHDLKEPLRTIGSFAQLLQRRYRADIDPLGQSYLDFIHQGAQNLNVLIEDLLQYAQIVDVAKKVQKVDLNKILKQVLYQLANQISETEAKMQFDQLPGEILASPSQMVHVFQNLIANALKFAKPGQPPSITIRSRKQDAGWLIEVADNGIGIDPEFHGTVFLLFKKLHTKDQYEGTGIGLALVKKIVEEHEGWISLVSALGEGTTFHIWLPDRKGPEESA